MTIVKINKWITQKHITVKQAIRLAKKFGKILDSDSFNNIRHNEILFIKKNEESGLITQYVMKKYFSQTFDFPYSCNSKNRVGKELMMSTFELPNITNFLRKKTR